VLLAGDEAEDGGLPGAVGSNQAAAGSGEDLERGVLKKNLRAVLPADVNELDHRVVPLGMRVFHPSYAIPAFH
jgi:hypothetical protein